MYPRVEDLIGFFTEDEEDCCCCCFCCCCSLSYVKETAGGEGISPSLYCHLLMTHPLHRKLVRVSNQLHRLYYFTRNDD